MKKIIITFSLVSILLPMLTLAQSGNPLAPRETGITEFTNKAANEAGYKTDSPNTLLATIGGQVVSAFLSLIGVLFMVYTLYGGYLWMTAGGNEERVTKAKAIIRNGAIGIIVVFSVYGIYLVIAAAFDPDLSSYPTEGY